MSQQSYQEQIMQINGRLIIRFAPTAAQPVDMPTAIAAGSANKPVLSSGTTPQPSTEHLYTCANKIVESPQKL
jgi:hypothetical protein